MNARERFGDGSVHGTVSGTAAAVPRLIIPRMPLDPADDGALDAAFARQPAHRIGCVGWPQEYPYAPEASFGIFHTGTALALRFTVREAVTAACAARDNDRVCADSCVELFIAFEGDGGLYYNFEANPVGTLMCAFRSGRAHPRPAPEEALRQIRRIASCGTACFAETEAPDRTHWRLTLVIPAGALFGSRISSFDGLRARANLYKCGDGLSRPHYLSWQPVDTAHPDFHRPECFADVRFE